MNTLWKFGIAGLILLVAVALGASPAAATSGVYWTKSYNLYPGQAVMHEIKVDCGAQLVLTSPYSGNFDLYAMRNYGSAGSCPSNEYIMTHYDKVAMNSGRNAYLTLESGLWCVLVYARSGSGTYLLEASSTCSGPYPTYSPYPTYNPYPTYSPPSPTMTPYKTDVKSGYLSQGQTKTTGYYIAGGRTYIEWILTGPCGEQIPVVMMSANQVSSMRTSYCGTEFDLYIYKDCNPGYRGCYAPYADTSTSSNAYVGISYPTTGSTYYAQVYAKQGSGYYTLTCRSYTGSDPVVMMSQPEMSAMMYTATSVAPPQ